MTNAVVSMSARSEDGRDAEYLAWHLLDHLPEQYSLPGVRLGQRWVSTPACRTERAASSAQYDRVDHVVAYVFSDPFAPTLDAWFDLGRDLRRAGRMPMALPSVEVAAYDLVEVRASSAALVRAEVVPWRPGSGAYLVVDGPGTAPVDLGALVALDGVAGAWRWTGTDRHRPDRLAPRTGTTLTIAYLDADPVATARPLGEVLRRHWSATGATSLLAAPFHAPVPGDWSRHLP